MTIPFRVKLLTPTAKPPHRNCESDLWDLYADDFCVDALIPKVKYIKYVDEGLVLYPNGRILVKTGITLELPQLGVIGHRESWTFYEAEIDKLIAYAVADLRPRSDNLEQKGLFIESKIIKSDEISFIAINHGHEPIIINKGDAIAKMIVYPFYASKMEVVDN